MKKQVSIIWFVISAVLIVLTVVLLIYVYWQRKEMHEYKEQTRIENERKKLEEEYADLFDAYNNYESDKLQLTNDSLASKLNREKSRVSRLLEELRTRKNFSDLTIDSLQNELQLLRDNIKVYEAAIDSLSRRNLQLQAEKNDALTRYRKASQEADQLHRDNIALNEKVTLAARLEALDITIKTLNKRGRKTDDKDKVDRVKVDFVIARNTLAVAGEKRIYLCIEKPDGNTLVKDRGNTFSIDNEETYYSLQQIIDYSGEEELMHFTWNVEEYLPVGEYNVDIYADSTLIGNDNFFLTD